MKLKYSISPLIIMNNFEFLYSLFLNKKSPGLNCTSFISLTKLFNASNKILI